MPNITSGKNIVDPAQLGPNVVEASELADNAVDTAAIQDSAVTSAKIATQGVESSNIKNDAVNTVKILDDAVTIAKLGNETQGEIIIYGAGGVPEALPVGTDGQVLVTGGAGADPSWENFGAVQGFTATDVLEESADTEREQGAPSATPTMIKEIKVRRDGIIRIKFDLKNNITAGGADHGRIYINDVAVGTSRSTGDSSYVTYSEDIEVVAGDLVQLYYWNTNSNLTAVRNFRFYYTIAELTTAETTVNTN